MESKHVPGPLLPDFAAKVAEWFPELGGRSLAVSEADMDRQKLPTLPLAMTALAASDMDGSWNWKSPTAQQTMYDSFVQEFWLKPMTVKREDGSETPFWSFYDYEHFRDVLLSHVQRYVGPRGQRVEYRRMTVEADAYAVILSFEFRAHFNWCALAIDAPGDGEPINSGTITRNMVPKPSPICDPCPEDHEEDCDPCPASV